MAKFLDRALSPWKPTLGTPVFMIGVRPGNAVLFCGASRPSLAGAVGAVTGLNGQTTVVDRRDGAAAQVAAGAEAAGALVDFEDAPLTLLPFDTDQWDVAVIADGLPALETDANGVLSEAIRVIRPGGRLILLDPVGRPGLFGLFRVSGGPAPPPEQITDRLTGVGLRAARFLAEVDGVRYFEAVKPNSADSDD